MKKILVYIILIFPFAAIAQSGYETVLQQIEHNNTALAALREQIESQKIGNRTGIYIPNPEVEFNYLWGNPKSMGKRTDFAVTQSFDFPTAYGHRRHIADLQNANAELVYKSERINLMLLAKQTCIELVYHNALAREYSVRLDNALRIAETYQIRLDQGDANILEYNKAKLNLTVIQTELAKIEAQRVTLLAELRRMNGGKEIALPQDEFSPPMLPANFEEWYAAVETKSPALQYVKGEIEIGKEQVRLSRALALPKFSTGYMSEKVVGEQFQGITLGVSIPLWENKNTQQYAKAQVKASEMALEDSKIQFYNRLQSLYLKASVLQQNALKFRQTITSNRNDALLKKALDSGEISLLDYLLEIGHYYDAIVHVIEAERDYELALAELSALEL
ncbi:MAG: TolC family protein [Bacteroidia bacterium]|nr:TolC family protein [Bacteroidia bacterium]